MNFMPSLYVFKQNFFCKFKFCLLRRLKMASNRVLEKNENGIGYINIIEFGGKIWVKIQKVGYGRKCVYFYQKRGEAP